MILKENCLSEVITDEVKLETGGQDKPGKENQNEECLIRNLKNPELIKQSFLILGSTLRITVSEDPQDPA